MKKGFTSFTLRQRKTRRSLSGDTLTLSRRSNESFQPCSIRSLKERLMFLSTLTITAQYKKSGSPILLIVSLSESLKRKEMLVSPLFLHTKEKSFTNTSLVTIILLNPSRREKDSTG